MGLGHGILTAELGETTWRKSRYRNYAGNCVELAVLGDDLVGIRHPVARVPGDSTTAV